ncbi:MAG: hypothetical protein HQ519_06225 [Planctomycetes bacterium]|nr:hypothetical protein [Planctomycetota bacterium]
MSDLPLQVRRDRRRWNQALAMSLAGTGCGIGLLIGGCAVVLGRVYGYQWDAPALLIGVGVGVIWAIRKFAQRQVNDEQIATLLDLRAGGAGLLLFELERLKNPSPAATSATATADTNAAAPADVARLSSHRMEAQTQPRPDIRRILRTLLPGLLFFAATLFLPVRVPAAVSADPISQRRIEELQQLAAALDETLVLDEQLREEIQQNLEALSSESNPEQPEGEALREALDQLESRMESVAAAEAQQLEDQLRQSADAARDAAAEDPMQRENALDMLGELAEKMKEGGALPEMPLNAEFLEQLAKNGLSEEFLEQLKKLAESGMLDQLGELARGMKLDPELAKKLAEMLSGQLSQAALEKLAELAKRGLLKNMQRMEGMEAGTHSMSELAEMLALEMGMGAMSVPGNGTGTTAQAGSGTGITRGPGSVPLTWGDETPDLRDQMKWQSMAAPDSPEEAMQIIRMTSSAPTIDAKAEGVGAADVVTGTPGETVWKRRMNPDHRQAVKRFFKPKD